ncbi:hypothetical protein Tco_0667381 [Tanacetum coccineum]
MSSASSAVTYTSVYTDSEPGRVFWGADDEEISKGGIPQIIDEDEREPMFVQAHDLDYVPEHIYPEYIPLEDEHEFPAEEQPLPPVDSPTAESPGYVTKSDHEEDPEEYKDDETDDGSVDYPMDEGDDVDDDDGDSSGDDADDENDDDEDEEEEHLAPTNSAIVVPADEPVSPPKGIEPRRGWKGGRDSGHDYSSPHHLLSLSPPSARERLARCMAPPAHSSPPPVSSPLLPSSGYPTQIQTLRIASTPALIDAVIAALPSPPLPPLPPSLYIPPLVDHMDDILEFEQLPRKRLCLSTLGSRYEIGESSTARSIEDRGVDYGFINTIDAEARRFTELAELHEHDTQDLYALLEDARDRDPSPGTLDTATTAGYSHSDTTSGTDGRDSACDERHEARDGRHVDRVASTVRTAES